jgi:hypothetical protein
MRTLTIGGFVFALVALVTLPVPFTLLAMTMGLIVLAKGKLANGSAVIMVAGVCGYCALHAWKPLDTFHEVNPLETMVEPAPQLPPAGHNDWRLLSLEARTVGQADGPVCEWKLVVRNESFQPQVYRGSLEFQDPRGTVVTEGRVESYKVPAGTVAVLTGSLPLRNGVRVARVVPQISAGG